MPTLDTSKNLDISKIIQEAYDQKLKDIGHINILFYGKTGTGKSTLINALFQGNFTETGQGRPVTTTTREIKKHGIPLTIYDTRGLEINAHKQQIDELREFIRKMNAEPDPQKHLHIACLCISEDSRRVEQIESELGTILSDFTHVICVITKSRMDQGFKAEVQRLIPDAVNTVRVRAIQEEYDDGYINPPMGLKNLIDAMYEIAPQAQKKAFAASQIVCLDVKKKQAHAVVITAAAAATTAAALPIPGSTALAIIPIEIAMIVSITLIFGIPVEKAGFFDLILAAISPTAALGAAVSAPLIVGELLKLVPGAGSIAGGAIAASYAGTMTSAFGELYISTLTHLFEKYQGIPTKEQILLTFKEKIRQNESK